MTLTPEQAVEFTHKLNELLKEYRVAFPAQYMLFPALADQPDLKCDTSVLALKSWFLIYHDFNNEQSG